MKSHLRNIKAWLTCASKQCKGRKSRSRLHVGLRQAGTQFVVEVRPPKWANMRLSAGTYPTEKQALVARDVVTYYCESELEKTEVNYNCPDIPFVLETFGPLPLPFEAIDGKKLASASKNLGKQAEHRQFANELKSRARRIVNDAMEVDEQDLLTAEVLEAGLQSAGVLIDPANITKLIHCPTELREEESCTKQNNALHDDNQGAKGGQQTTPDPVANSEGYTANLDTRKRFTSHSGTAPTEESSKENGLDPDACEVQRTEMPEDAATYWCKGEWLAPDDSTGETAENQLLHWFANAMNPGNELQTDVLFLNDIEGTGLVYPGGGRSPARCTTTTHDDLQIVYCDDLLDVNNLT